MRNFEDKKAFKIISTCDIVEQGYHPNTARKIINDIIKTMGIKPITKKPLSIPLAKYEEYYCKSNKKQQ